MDFFRSTIHDRAVKVYLFSWRFVFLFIVPPSILRGKFEPPE